MPADRITRATRLRLTATPPAVSSAWFPAADDSACTLVSSSQAKSTPTIRCRTVSAGISNVPTALGPGAAKSGAAAGAWAHADGATAIRPATHRDIRMALPYRTVTRRLPEQLLSLRSPATDSTHAL